MKKFIDTAPFIYLIEDHPDFSDIVANIISESLVRKDVLETSVITLLEFGVKPERENRQDVISKFNELLLRLNITMKITDEEVAKKAYQLRAKYQFLKSMDAIQLAIALLHDCEEFITNDRKLKRVDELNVIVIDEIETNS